MKEGKLQIKVIGASKLLKQLKKMSATIRKIWLDKLYKKQHGGNKE